MNSIINRLDYDIKFAIFIENVFKVAPPEKTLDVMISDSFICTELENNRSSFFYLSDKDIFLKTIENQYTNINDDYSDIALWISKTYLDIFFKYQKSFQYIISYLPVSEMTYLYKTFHQANETMIEKEFLARESKTSLLKILLKRKGLTLNQLSALTKINYNTLDKYIRNNNYLHVASYDNIYILSKVLSVRENIFASKLFINNIDEMPNKESFDSIMDQIVLTTLIYNDVTLAKNNYQYLPNNHTFISKKNKLFIFYKDNLNNLSNLLIKMDTVQNKNNFVAIFAKSIENIQPFILKHLSKVYLLNKDKFVIISANNNSIIKRKQYVGLLSTK